MSGCEWIGTFVEVRVWEGSLGWGFGLGFLWIFSWGCDDELDAGGWEHIFCSCVLVV